MQIRTTAIKTCPKARQGKNDSNLARQRPRWFPLLVRLIAKLLSAVMESLPYSRLLREGGEEAEGEKSRTKKNDGNQEHPKQEESRKNSAKPGDSDDAVVPPTSSVDSRAPIFCDGESTMPQTIPKGRRRSRS